MKKLLILKIILSCFILVITRISIAQNSQKHELNITIKNIRSTSGSLIVSFYHKNDDFPDKPYVYKTYKKSTLKIVNGTAIITIVDVKNEDLALVLLDDENNDSKMNYSFFGMPEEGYAFSNGAQPKLLNSPTFDDSKFKITGPKTNTTLSVTYF